MRFGTASTGLQSTLNFQSISEKSEGENKVKIYTVAISRGALLGANANNGANAGFGYLNANNRSSNSNANIGFRFYRDF